MNRSIYQIWRKNINNFKIINFLILLLILFFIVNLNNNVNCINLKCFSDFSKYALKEMSHNQINFFKNELISEYDSKIALDLFLEYKINNNLNYNFSKYFINNNGILIPFNKKSPYSHPNLFLGIYNDIFFNYQFSHKKINSNFNLFSNVDIVDAKKNQFVSKYLYMYSLDLSQIMLNCNPLNLNLQYYELNSSLLNDANKNSTEAQNFLNDNKNKFDRLINKSIKN